MSTNRVERLAKISKDLMFKEPFYGMFLITLNKRWENRIETAAVGKNGINFQLMLNEKFWDEQNDAQALQLVKHELLHIGFFHLTDFDHQTDRKISNIAQDLEINQYLDRANMPGKGGVHIDQFPELKLEAKKGSNYYYEKLTQASKNNSCPNLDAMLEGMENGSYSATITMKGKDTEVDVSNHSSRADEFGDVDEATKKLIRNQTEHLLKEVADAVIKSQGHVPGEFQEILDRINTIDPPKFDWRSYLRRFTGGSTKTYTKKTRRKYNKRYDENPGLKIKWKRHILVAIDTSGSVSSNELREFLHEIHHMQKTGSEITIAQADTAISHIGPFNARSSEFKVHGRGGTSFHPVLEYYNNNTHKYTCLLYFTDGEACAPPAARGKMLWVLSSQSKRNESLIGPQIVLN